MEKRTFGDMWAVCQDCGQRFVFRVTEQHALYRQGKPVEAPELCSDCRRRDRRQDAQRDAGNGRETGQVKWFSPRRGYGFIIRADGREIFFHRNDVRGAGFRYLGEGQLVSFERRRTPKGLEAVEVQVVGMESFSYRGR